MHNYGCAVTIKRPERKFLPRRCVFLIYPPQADTSTVNCYLLTVN